MRLLPLILSLSVTLAAAQDSPPPVPESQSVPKPISVDLVKDYAKLLAQRYSNPKDLQATADRLARHYAGELQKIRREVSFLVSMASDKARDLGLQERLNVALELWRVRASLDLLALANPETLHELTGMTLPDLSRLRKQVHDLKPW